MTLVEQSGKGQKTLAPGWTEALGSEPRDLVHLGKRKKKQKQTFLLMLWLVAPSSQC